MQRATLLFLLVFAAFGQTPGHKADYALILADAPVARTSPSRLALQSSAAQAGVQSLRNAQSGVLAELSRRKVAVQGTSQILVNAIFVSATRDTAVQLLNIPGVVHVVPAPRMKRELDQALALENVTAAWSAVGGATNAGAGIKIGIIDTGIDQTHPGFIDPSLKPPAGFPKGDSNFTNSKVIVARSYVAMDNYVDLGNSTPDDTSARDRVGHGTAIAMIAAGVQNTGPQATIQGVAPKAFLGSYKVFGSPGISDYARQAAIAAALQDAVTDGMDIVTLSLGEGNPASYGPLDTASVDPSCDGTCDLYNQMVTNAVTAGVVVIVAAGNDGKLGTRPHTLSTIHTPGTAPAAITVGASYNSHVLYQTVQTFLNAGAGAAANLQSFHALYSDGPQLPLGVFPVVDVATLQNNGLACTALPAGSLLHDIALIQRGDCPFNDKIINAQNAGAFGVILYMQAGTDPILSPTGANDTGIPAVMISYADGVNLKNSLPSNPNTSASFDPTFTPVSNPPNSIWPSSSRGPSIGTFALPAYQTFVIKPEMVAVGAGIYTATQKYDPNGDAYNATGYTGVSGTSYAVPMVAGAVAMVKQMHPTWTPAQLKSAVVNTATQDVTDTDGSIAGVDAVGTGKLSAGDSLNVAATLDPATIEFGTLSTSSISNSITLNITNVNKTSATFAFSVQPSMTSSVTTAVTVGVSPATLTLAPGQTNSVSVTLRGTLPSAGSYEGLIAVTGGGGVTLHVPYQFLVTDLTVADVFPDANGGFIDNPGDPDFFVQVRAIDKYGVPLVSTPVKWNVVSGGGSIDFSPSLTNTQTARYGEASAFLNIGTQLGPQVFTATVGGISAEFDGYARPYPVIAPNGVTDGAAFQFNRGLAPGSYITIKGTNLADATRPFFTNYLPVSLSDISVSFDGGGLSLPGPLSYVSPGQINVQIPWEFEGQQSVSMKVNVTGNVWFFLQTGSYTVPLANYCPNFFENSGIVAAVDFNSGSVVGSGAPVQKGDVVELYANGLGPVTNQASVLSGQPSPGGSLLAQTTTLPTVTVGGVNAPVSFAGLVPPFVGLYQVNIVVPSAVPSGMQPVVLTIGTVSTQVSQLPVK